MSERVRVGSLEELRTRGSLTTKVGTQPVFIVWCEKRAYAVDDRCPHLGFPLHRGSVENGLLTCHWHHARFDLESGGTLDPFADDVRAYAVEFEGDDVLLDVTPVHGLATTAISRLEEGLEQGLSLVIAKAVLDILDTKGDADGTAAILRCAVAFGTRYRQQGWGPGLSVLTSMANVLPMLQPADRALALVHGLSFVSNDTRGGPPRFGLAPLSSSPDPQRLDSWYRRFVDTRNGDAAERVLATACRSGLSPADLAAMTGAASTDHVFVDGGHTVDFVNKAFEILDHVGFDEALTVLPTLARQSAAASRSEESGSWRHPDNLVDLLETATTDLGRRLAAVQGRSFGEADIDALAWSILGDDAEEVINAIGDALDRGATPEELARAVAYAAALRLARFHTENDHADWDVVHHGFTTANAVHALIRRAPTVQLLRGVYHGAAKVFLDRFLNVPAARLPTNSAPDDGRGELSELQRCWDQEGLVDEAGGIVYRWLRGGGDRAAVLAALGSALLTEDAEFHWFQTYEAAVQQSNAWGEGTEQEALILTGAARFLAAHTPTRRELSQVVRIAARLRRGDPLYEF